jgi:hypothetical protein
VDQLKSGQRAYVGVTDVIDPHVESAETVRDRVLAAATRPVAQLRTTDDCASRRSRRRGYVSQRRLYKIAAGEERRWLRLGWRLGVFTGSHERYWRLSPVLLPTGCAGTRTWPNDWEFAADASPDRPRG